MIHKPRSFSRAARDQFAKNILPVCLSLFLLFASCKAFTATSQTEQLSFSFVTLADCLSLKEDNSNRFCSIYPDKLRDWTTDEKREIGESISKIAWSRLQPVVSTVLKHSTYPVLLVKVDDDTFEASSSIFEDKLVIFISSRLLSTQTNYSHASEATHTLTHELFHFYFNLKYHRDYFLGPFWVALAQAVDWTNPRGAHPLFFTADVSEVQKHRQSLLAQNKKEEALKYDSDFAKTKGFPSLYSMMQIEEFAAEVLTYLVYDANFSKSISKSLYDFIGSTDFKSNLQPFQKNLPKQSSRKILDKSLSFIGRLNLESRPLCTVFLVEHGRAITAKHCYFAAIDKLKRNLARHLLPKRVTMPGFISLEFQGQSQQFDLVITGLQIKSFFTDEGNRDLAYISYDPEVTRGKLLIPTIEFSTDPIGSEKTDLITIGYPLPQKARTSHQILSVGRSSGTRGRLDEVLPDIEGELVNTNIFGWYSASGSPIFRATSLKSNQFKLVGVLSHTFEIDQNGQVIKSRIQSDKWGPGTTTNFAELTKAIFSAAFDNESEKQ